MQRLHLVIDGDVAADVGGDVLALALRRLATACEAYKPDDLAGATFHLNAPGVTGTCELRETGDDE